MPPQTRKRTRAKNTDSPGMQIDLNGKTYIVRESDLSSRDIAALRRETGFAGWVGLTQEAARGFDLDVLAALVWLARRVEGQIMPYETVLDEIGYDSELEVSVEDKRTRAEGDSPEA